MRQFVNDIMMNRSIVYASYVKDIMMNRPIVYASYVNEETEKHNTVDP